MYDFSKLNPDDGIDRKQLKRLKQRFLGLNTVRLERTRQAIGIRQQLFLDVLPVLLHVNHPMLPGYQGSDTPCGIPYFKPNSIQISAAKIITRSFELKKTFAQQELAIDALFIMGSVGTIAHSERSDFDIWVCHKNSIPQKDLTKLEAKFEAISAWADKELGVEAHFFPVCGDRKQGKPASGAMSKESSGSAQNHLLLDEFYRSAIWVAGKIPLWWYVPVKHENNYQYFTDQLLKKRFIRKQDVVDFGPITHIPHEEYLGAGIWQLYKGINSPHKSVIKLMLLEAYAVNGTAYPLALDYKSIVHQSEPCADEVDSYLLIYKRIEEYFTKTNQNDRLDLARRCFYFKVNKALTHQPSSREKSWQRILLEKFVVQWQWDNTQLLRLDSHKLWKANQVIHERDLLIKELSQSYRLLSNLSRQSFQKASISSQELAILGRKLHAAFERKSGKIETINPEISKDLSEPNIWITFNEDKPHWSLFKDKRSQKKTSPQIHNHLLSADSYYALLVWAIWNGIVDTATQVEIQGNNCLRDTEQQNLIQRTKKWLSKSQSPPSHEAFMETAHVARVQIAINLISSAYENYDKQGLTLLSEQSDALNYSGLHDNLVRSADIAHINSWSELIVRNYNRDSLSEILIAYLRFAPPHAIKTPPELDIVCPDQQFGALIENRLYELFNRITQCFYGVNGNSYARYLIETHRHFYVVQFHQGTPSVTKLRSIEDLFRYMETPQSHDRPLILDSKALLNTALRCIIESTKPAQHYLYYEMTDSGIIYTYCDVSGALFRFNNQSQDRQAYPLPIINFIASVNARLSSQGEKFALDHFVSLDNSHGIEIRQVINNGKDYTIECHNDSTATKSVQYTDIKVIVEPDENLCLHYTIICDNHEYNAKQLDPFEMAARYILHKRQGKNRYHCHISDLDLTACSDLLAPETGLQLIHYLQQKRSIESRLNQALTKIYR
ncbi:class I adenylate cyclase [Gilvimarinus agarilyticus]|uniref:class I adenylate cyclase n=1 Tax=Gilvimarinus sp. 2_MG-2023 TaxID=3062666 RepID=UPI001C085F0F|nr:class I adenylate cyclase [Gilvimarinus sp. 2_MG-2023]MBU2885534.1 class I adenylate cyclase [Gilvimarinus agarilyticus]MDO6570433.1 class I adenylate cyclase [Gilvimarinus sp. 2_MG-2023]